MNLLIMIAALLIAAGLLAYLKAPLAIATVACVVGLLLLGNLANSFLSGTLLLFAWLGWFGMLALNFTPLRQRYLTQPVLDFFRQRRCLPCRRPNATRSMPARCGGMRSCFPVCRRGGSCSTCRPRPLSVEEQAFLDGPVEELCRMVDDWTISHELGDLPPVAWAFIKAQGFLGIIIPKSYGGLRLFRARAFPKA